MTRAIEGGHVWVPIVFREEIFRNREVVLPFDRPPRLDKWMHRCDKPPVSDGDK